MNTTPSSFILHRFSFLILFSSFIVHPSSFSSAGLPYPQAVYYGQALDGYGWPYVDHAEVILLRGTNTIATHAIDGSLAPGVNFAMHVPLDDGRNTNRYVATALRTGEVVSIVVDDRYGRQTIMESNAVPAVAEPGELILINVTAGTDADGDGLPDQWEEELLAYGGNPAVTSIWDIVGSGDFDGDGQSNGDEYRAGTFAFLNYDFFYAEAFAPAPGGRLKLEWLSVRAKAYRVQSTTNLLSGVWADRATASTPDGTPASGPIEGDGTWLTRYVDFGPPGEILRITVE